MRSDSRGIFWQDEIKQARGSNRVEVARVPPPIPDTGWLPPEAFPKLGRVIALDTETKDPNLLQKGPGYIRGDGHVVGISLADEESGGQWYFPIRHELGGNMDEHIVLRWLKRELGRHVPGRVIVGANLMYDLGWLRAEGVEVHPDVEYFDIQWAEALIYEHRFSYSLNAVAKLYLDESKTDEELYEWCRLAYGGKPGRGQATNIYRAPTELVGPYAEQDAALPLKIRACQLTVLEDQDLASICNTEHRLIPMLLAMRFRGVRVDASKAEAAGDMLQAKLDEAQKVLDDLGGFKVNVNMADDLAKCYDKAGIAFPKTPKTQKPSFTRPWLEGQGDPLSLAVVAVRKYEKNLGTFVDGYINEFALDGRIHAEFHPLRSDDGGTVSGRFSSSNPNLQNIPSRDKVLGPLIRSIFRPEPGEKWAKQDYSQVEYRLLTHFASGTGAEDARDKYRDDATTDFHGMVSSMSGLDRKPAKNLNFGMVYGQGLATTARTMGCSKEQASIFREVYFEQAPFVKHTFDLVQGVAQDRGWIKSISGRRHRFDFWEAADFNLSNVLKPQLSKEGMIQAVENAREIARKSGKRVPMPGVRRAKTHKALNALLQGSSADIIKEAMVEIWDAGICGVLGAPLVQVHDELDWSVPDNKAGHEALQESSHIMETVRTLRVPVKVDTEIGASWGEL